MLWHWIRHLNGYFSDGLQWDLESVDHNFQSYEVKLTCSIFESVTWIKMLNSFTAAKPFSKPIIHLSAFLANGQESQSIVLQFKKKEIKETVRTCYYIIVILKNIIVTCNLIKTIKDYS